MALTEYQLSILRLLAGERKRRGERYVAGGAALNALLRAPCFSRDLNIIHDSDEAIAESWDADRRALVADGHTLAVVREAPAFIEALVTRGSERTAGQWAGDSAFRFFPLIEDETLGMALHPFDLATKKVLAMAGRLEVRDWVDVITCDEKLQPFGYLVWAACDKDPGCNPKSILAVAQRERYSRAEIETLDFHEARPDATGLGERWHAMDVEAGEITAALPAEELGTCVIDERGKLYDLDAETLLVHLREERVRFHSGSIGGVWPRVFDPRE
jgi:hypothetical protein